MIRPVNFTISGLSGSGKGVVSFVLANRLGFEVKSAGGFCREMAEKLGWTLEEWLWEAQKDPDIDRAVDDATRLCLCERTGIILESRLGHWFAQDLLSVFKVCLCADNHVRWARIAQRDFSHLSSQDAYHTALRKTCDRDGKDLKRYQDLYHLDNFLDRKYFDLVLDTNNCNPDFVVDEIIRASGFLDAQ